MKGYLSITQLSKIKHITTETLRHYDRIGLFVPDYVEPDTRYRYYSLEQIEKIDTILELRDMGMSLADIDTFMKNRDVNLSYQLLSKKEKELEREIREKRRILKNIQNKRKYIEELWRAEEAGEFINTLKLCNLKEEAYVVSLYERWEMEEYLLDATKLKENLKEEASVFATNYIGSKINAASFLDETKQCFLRAATLPAVKCRKTPKDAKLEIMPAGEYLCGKGSGYFRFGCSTEKKIKQWLFENGYEICGDIIECDDIDMALTNKEEEIIFGFKVPVKKVLTFV